MKRLSVLVVVWLVGVAVSAYLVWVIFMIVVGQLIPAR
jgi:hypothetical protein